MTENVNIKEEMANDAEIDPFAQTLAEKMQIARNVVIQCERTQNCNEDYISKSSSDTDHFPRLSGLKEIIIYTGVCEDTVKMADMSLKMSKTFTEWFIEKMLPVDAKFSFVPGSIHNIVKEFYTKRIEIATKIQIVNGLLDRRCLRLLYKSSRLKKDIFHSGFIWKRLPGTKKSILVERVDQSLHRMEYLTKMKTYRENGRNFVYINAQFHNYQLVVSPQHGLLYMNLGGCQTKGNKLFDVWLTKVLVTFPKNSVVVLKEEDSKQMIPTPYASKCDMMNWLSEHDVPFRPDYHKADLYALIKKFKHLAHFHDAVYAIIKSHGHDVIYRPKELSNLSIPNLSTKQKCIKDKTNEDWQIDENILINKEKEFYQEEILMETVIDKILTMAKYGELTDEDLKECDDEFPVYEYYSSIILD